MRYFIKNNIIILNLNEINSDLDLYKVFGDAYNLGVHPYKLTHLTYNIAIKEDQLNNSNIKLLTNWCLLRSKQNKINFYIIRKYKNTNKLIKINWKGIYHCYSKNIVNLLIPEGLVKFTFKGKECYKHNDAYFKLLTNINFAKNVLYSIKEYSTFYYFKDASCYDNDFKSLCSKEESTYSEFITIHYKKYNNKILNIIGNTNLLKERDKKSLKNINKLVFYNLDFNDKNTINNLKIIYNNTFKSFKNDVIIDKITAFNNFFNLNLEEENKEIFNYYKNILNDINEENYKLFINLNKEYADAYFSYFKCTNAIKALVYKLIKNKEEDASPYYEDRNDNENKDINDLYLE